MPDLDVPFGYCPDLLDVSSGAVRISPLAELEETVRRVEASAGVDDGWIHAPNQRVRDLASGQAVAKPYADRVFGLPRTHRLLLAGADGENHIAFHLWGLSFLTGMRLTATEAGFVDATPIRPGTLVDFMLSRTTIAEAVARTEAFWKSARTKPERTGLAAAAIHALFLAQNPRNLQFESFLFLYAALDACYALASTMHTPPPRLGHARRIGWMCGLFRMPIPVWADPDAPGGAEASVLRNAAVHEAQFMGMPLGFALHGEGSEANLPLEMEALICRLLVALVWSKDADYVVTGTGSRQCHGLTLI